MSAQAQVQPDSLVEGGDGRLVLAFLGVPGVGSRGSGDIKWVGTRCLITLENEQSLATFEVRNFQVIICSLWCWGMVVRWPKYVFSYWVSWPWKFKPGEIWCDNTTQMIYAVVITTAYLLTYNYVLVIVYKFENPADQQKGVILHCMCICSYILAHI